MIKQWYNCGYPVLPDILHRNVLAIIAKKSPPGNNLGDHRGITIPTVQSKVFSMFNGFNIDAWNLVQYSITLIHGRQILDLT